ncbi:phosphoadenosine phosphosulfate reductase family protein isoform 1 [Plasmopara halstedii]|uniref:FAD synthase n=1 Tax=Plasmopara halstedii TaxID=4781 RepID=A0A0P1AUP6_PLAHL|nr:phosphoadenosine phosphosulfate reductase family protein isoform 1 [Plasmopara halstedii]CEG46004.1 phosphoadenosine phosphosulfate reductase family protein isoform 1 [Plasmopara halstedii]|eukprot:XP_024582373.1 phosphoadenosine phosphosulfate reductase family protein isoform 1 [Plasmopara halstedii]
MNNTGMRSILLRFDLLYAGADAAMKRRLQKALDVIRSAIDIFGLEGVCFSFNGGKDSTVILHLLRIVIAKRVLEEVQLERIHEAVDCPKTITSPRNSFLSADLMDEDELEARVMAQLQRVPVMYFDSYDQFQEVREFTEKCTKQYGLSCHVYKCSFVEGVKDILDKLQIKGIYMGVRGGDPHTEDMEHFSPSSPGWPAFLRVNPILKWTYADVWKFLRNCDLDYCSLYDHGYTSLGNVFDTVQNPELWRKGEDAKEGYYLPAHDLKDGSSERCGRQKKAHTTSKSD